MRYIAGNPHLATSPAIPPRSRYTTAAGTMPIVQALMDKAMPLGTTLAVVTSGIIAIGYLFNAIM